MLLVYWRHLQLLLCQGVFGSNVHRVGRSLHSVDRNLSKEVKRWNEKGGKGGRQT